MSVPISHLLPLSNENRWSDLLAVLVEANPTSASTAFGLQSPLQHVRVRREVPTYGRDRLDLLISDSDGLRAVVEVKVLSGLGRRQLRRYRAAFPDAEQHVLIFPQRLPIHVAASTGWATLTWDRLLATFARSPNGWVAETALSWSDHLEHAMPRVDGQTGWNELRDGEDFVVAMRARMSWVFEALDPLPQIELDVVESSAGVSWMARMNAPAKAPGYLIRVEAEENLPVRDYPKYASATAPAVRGPSVKVCLVQTGVDTSRDFDWEYLLSLWQLMSAARSDWVTAPARPKAPHDRDRWQQMVARGGPRHLGIGFGDAQARRAHECMFGARFQLPPNVRLEQVVQALRGTADLMIDMAAAEPPAAGVA